MKNEKLRAFLKMSRQKQIATVLAVWFVCFFLCLYILGSLSAIAKGDNSFTGAIAAGFTNAFTISFLFSVFLFAVLAMFIFFAKRNMRNTVESEKDGIFYANDKNSGASRWQTEDEIRSNFAVGKVEDLKGTIYGRLKTYGSDSVVTWKPSETLTEAQKRRGMKQAPEGNRNVLVIATMKTLNDVNKKNDVKSKAAEEVKAEPEKIDFSKVKIEPLFEEAVDFDTFSKSDFRAVKVKECVAVPKSKKLLQFTLDDGTGIDRTILSGIHAYYEPEELVGKTLIAITNLPPRKMMGIESCGMLLSAVNNLKDSEDEELHLVMVDNHIPAGAKLY